MGTPLNGGCRVPRPFKLLAKEVPPACGLHHGGRGGQVVEHTLE